MLVTQQHSISILNHTFHYMKNIIALPVLLSAAIVAVFLIEVILPGNLTWLGIRPRSISGLPGILVSPFLHASLKHLLANIVPLLIMGCLVSALAPALFATRTVALVLFSGALTWLISSSGVVVGASGLVFAYWSFLITNGFLRKSIKDVGIALLTFLIYGALIFGLFKFQYGVSWAGHFSGVVAGIFLAYLQRSSRNTK